MKKTIVPVFAAAFGLAFTAFADGEIVDRPGGITIGQRLTLRPYVSFSYTFDSNVDSSRNSSSSGSSSFVVSPRLTADYASENWSVNAGVYYDYHAYTGSSRNLNSHSYGENVDVTWNSLGLKDEGGKGWNLTLSQSYRMISQDDDMTNSDGRGIGRDRQQFTIDGALGHYFTERFHANVHAGYYWLDYKNDQESYAPLYGWSRANVGGELGYTASKYLDFLLVGQWHWYEQDNNVNASVFDRADGQRHLGNNSDGWTVQAGIGTHATERLSYRALVGWSRFNYADSQSADGFTYTLSSQYKVSDSLSMMLMGSSYYQPNERHYASGNKVYTISYGLAKSFVKGQWNATFDMSYRYEDACTCSNSSADYGEDVLTARVGLNYRINRFVSCFGRVEYQTEWTHGGEGVGNDYDYDRWRATVGFTLSY